MPPSNLPASLGRTSLRRLALSSQETPCLLRSAAACRALSSSSRQTQTSRPSSSPRPARSLLRTQPSLPTTSLPSSRHPRAYHSATHPPPPGPFSPAELALLGAAYAHVPAHGFSAESLALGARDLGLLDISANLIPQGEFDLIRYHLHAQREALVDVAAGLPRSSSVADKVFALTWARLVGNKDVIGRWQEALAIMAQPSYVPASVKALAELSDDIWYLAGDVSVDPSWYTKRASLSAVYVSAELAMTDDRSPGFADTNAFLRRRFAEAGDLGNVLGAVGEWLSFTGNAAVNVLRSKGARV